MLGHGTEGSEEEEGAGGPGGRNALSNGTISYGLVIIAIESISL